MVKCQKMPLKAGMQSIAPRFLDLDPSLDLPLTFFVLVLCCKMQMAERYLMRCVASNHSMATWLRLCMPCITRGSWQALGEWQIGSLRKCEQREGHPSSIIVCDTLRETILIKKMLDNDSGVGAGGGDSCAGCTGFEQQHLCPHTHTTHSPFQAGSGATCGCERLHRAGGRRRGRSEAE